MKVEDLINAGYKKYIDQFSKAKYGNWYQGSYQRRFQDEIGTRYFITICHGIMPAMNGKPEREFFTAENQFSKNEKPFNIEKLYHGESLKEIEDFFADLWRNMLLDYYETGPNNEKCTPQQNPA